ncbi:MAG: MFS transporter [Rubrobacter sp.]|nr:MFS transporter [Rubrobacter sp.]
MLVTIAADLDVSLSEVAVAASVYFLLYGLMQPVWGALSDRIGRVNVIRLTLVAALLPGLLSALAPNLAALVVGRALAGGLFAAVIPASLVYIGDTVPISTRQKALADQLATSAVATALATVTAGIAAYLDLWRLAFAAPVLASATLGLLLIRRLPEPEHDDGDAGILARLGTVFRKPWALLVVLLALVEGGVILGFLTYLAPALEDRGFSSAASGLVVGLYGIATLAWTRLLKRLTDRVGAYVLLVVGGALLAAGYAAGAVEQNLVGISLAAVFVGGGFAFMHSTLQTWATEVTPEARATVISLFAAALFTGSGLATSAAAPLAERGSFGLLFAIAALIALPLGLIGGLARRRYGRK